MCTACALHMHRMRTARTPHALHAHRMYQVSLAQLDEAIGRAEARGRLACVKYYAPWCQSCFAIKPLYERTAGARLGSHRMSQTRASPHVHCMCLVGAGKMGDLTPTPFLTLARALTLTEGKMGEHVDFYEVDGGCARELIALADVRNFPVRIVSRVMSIVSGVKAAFPVRMGSGVSAAASIAVRTARCALHTLCTPMQLASPHSSPRHTGAPARLHLCSSAGDANIRARRAAHDAPDQQQGSLRRVQRGPGGPGA